MQVFFFDRVTPDEIIIDDVGMELGSLQQALREARLSLGDEARAFASHGREGHIALIVRDTSGPLFEFSADFSSRPLP